MVFIGALRAVSLQSAKMRVPSIKFRKGSPAPSHVSSASSAMPPQKSAGIGNLTVVYQELPARFARKPLSVEEIDYINRGGPA